MNNELGAFFALAIMLVTDPRNVALFVLLVAAAVADVRHQRIPNRLTLGGLAFGLAYSTVEPFWGGHGFLWSLAGAGVGFAVLFPLWLLHLTGAGDVKLMAMAGSLLGMQAVQAALIATMIAGAVFAIGYSIKHGKLRQMLANVGRILRFNSVAVATGTPVSMAAGGWESVGKLAFAVPIALGTITTTVAAHFGFL